jgi:hypothetical protein
MDNNMDDFIGFLSSSSKDLRLQILAELLDLTIELGVVERWFYHKCAAHLLKEGIEPPPWREPTPKRQPVEAMKYYRPVWPPTWRQPSTPSFGQN